MVDCVQESLKNSKNVSFVLLEDGLEMLIKCDGNYLIHGIIFSLIIYSSFSNRFFIGVELRSTFGIAG